MYALAVALAMLCSIACEREQHRVQDFAAFSSLATLERPSAVIYQENAWAVSEGQRLFVWMNCVSCHGAGGGAMGPALMDNTWRYGSDPQTIYETIVGGRPNGMPAFGGKLPEQQVWQLVAYVRSLSGLLRLDVNGGRRDALSAAPPPVMRDHSDLRDDIGVDR